MSLGVRPAGTARCPAPVRSARRRGLAVAVVLSLPLVTWGLSAPAGAVASGGDTHLTPGRAPLTVTSGSNPSLPGRPVTFTATVSTASVAPTGTVTFSEGGRRLCSEVPVADARAACTAGLPITPSQTITATYSGDPNYPTSTAAYAQSVAHGYWTVAADGGVFAFGDAPFYGSEGAKPLNKPIVGMAATPDAEGYWLVAADGGIFAFGDAGFYGSTGRVALASPVIGMAATPDAQGYWLVAADGGVFAFGDARYFGSEAGRARPVPIVGMAGTSSGQGYWLVAADGSVFGFGDAGRPGSGAIHSTSPVVGVAATPTGDGYWLATANGAVLPFGDARGYGSMAGQPLHTPIVGIGATADGQGYWLVAADGGIFAFGDAIFDGSTGNRVLNSPMVTLAAI